MANGTIEKKITLSRKTYTATFEANSYVSPYIAIYRGQLVSASDIAAYGEPLFGISYVSGAPNSICDVSTTGYVSAVSSRTGEQTIQICFVK